MQECIPLASSAYRVLVHNGEKPSARQSSLQKMQAPSFLSWGLEWFMHPLVVSHLSSPVQWLLLFCNNSLPFSEFYNSRGIKAGLLHLERSWFSEIQYSSFKASDFQFHSPAPPPISTGVGWINQKNQKLKHQRLGYLYASTEGKARAIDRH